MTATIALRLLAASSALLVACAEAPVSTASAADAAAADAGRLLQAEPAMYPRAIRLAHQRDLAANGTVLASATVFPGGRAQGAVFASRDGGASFSRRALLSNPAWADGLCCGTLFELPRAVGALPAGTVLWSASVGQQTAGVPMRHPILASHDAGATWRHLSDCGVAQRPYVPGRPGGVWEPQFAISPAGELLCYYSDETDDGRSQTLKVIRSADGLNWSAPQRVVDTGSPSDRPGMAVVHRLVGGRYLLTYEMCGAAGTPCRVYAKFSDDGMHWPPLADRGVLLQTADGRHFLGAPVHVPAPTAAAPRRVVLTAQRLVDASGQIAPGNGATLFVHDDPQAGGPWRTHPAPMRLPNPPTQGNPCQNYSPALLPSPDGARILMINSDHDGQRRCVMRFATGSLPPP